MTVGETSDDASGPAICGWCNGPLLLAADDRPSGPVVIAFCKDCETVTVPYEGPGAQEAIQQHRRKDLQ
jgi:hypothetical protein